MPAKPDAVQQYETVDNNPRYSFTSAAFLLFASYTSFSKLVSVPS
jgi:hypothetical protein